MLDRRSFLERMAAALLPQIGASSGKRREVFIGGQGKGGLVNTIGNPLEDFSGGGSPTSNR